VILSFDGHAVSTYSELPELVADATPGTMATLEISRDGARKQIEVKVGELESTKVTSAGTTSPEQGRLGVEVRPLNSDEQQQAGTQGLLIENASGPAARAGIEAGDLLLAVNGTPVASVAQLRALVAKSGKTLALLIQRDDGKIFVPVQLDGKQG
jgi:serine protease Do